MRIAHALRALAEATTQASRWHPTTQNFQREAAIAGRAYERAESQAAAVKGLPRHARARRVVEQALEVAQECLSGLVGTVDKDTLVYRANALRRATALVDALTDLGQRQELGHERVVGEGAASPALDMLDALFPRPTGELVQSDRSDQA